MRVSDLKGLGLRQKTLDELEVNIGDVITNDEFHRPGNSKDYRTAAVDRLVEMKVPFTSNTNILNTMVKRLITVSCPYCGTHMEWTGASGNGSSETVRYACTKCGGSVNLSLDSNGISVDDPRA